MTVGIVALSGVTVKATVSDLRTTHEKWVWAAELRRPGSAC